MILYNYLISKRVVNMDKVNNEDGIIFSKDINFLYNVRNKCSEAGIFLNYSQTVEDYILYLVGSDGGIILIDYKYFDDIKFLLNYYCSYKCQNFTFVYITEDKIDIDLGKNSYIINLDELKELLPKLKYLSYAQNHSSHMSKSDIYKNTIDFLEMYGISPKHAGYSYIKECVALGVENNSGILNFSNNIYPIIATKYNTCTGNVDKNIRTAIKKAYENNPKLFELDDVNHKSITNAGFLNYIIEKVKIKCIEG